MDARLWYMNADCESELARLPERYFRPASFDAINRRLAERLLLLARAGDALLIAEPWSDELRSEAARREVELIAPDKPARQSHRRFTPWGWTPSAIQMGEQAGAIVEPIAPEIVRRVSSKLWSYELERELGVALPGASVARTFDELREMIAASFPGEAEKWVIKSLFGFAARDRVLGRGGEIGAAQGAWARKMFARGEALIIQPWLDVTREYGVAGELDALEHARGFHPLLEVNARYTMGFVALAAERELAPRAPVLWSTK